MAGAWGALTTGQKTRENRLRRQAKRLGLAVTKSRVREIHLDDHGGYQIVDRYRNSLVHGERYELDLDDLAEYLAGVEENLKSGREPNSERTEGAASEPRDPLSTEVFPAKEKEQELAEGRDGDLPRRWRRPREGQETPHREGRGDADGSVQGDPDGGPHPLA